MTSKEVIFIPYWVEKAISLNNMRLSDVLDFSKMYAVMTHDDLSAFLNVQRVVNAQHFAISQSEDLFNNWQKSCPDNLKVELDSIFTSMSHSESISKDVMERLSVGMSLSQDDGLHYKVVDFERKQIGIVIYPGFLDTAKAKALVLVAYFSDILKILYKYMPVHIVSATPVFKYYLKYLKEANAS